MTIEDHNKLHDEMLARTDVDERPKSKGQSSTAFYRFHADDRLTRGQYFDLLAEFRPEEQFAVKPTQPTWLVDTGDSCVEPCSKQLRDL